MLGQSSFRSVPEVYGEVWLSSCVCYGALRVLRQYYDGE
jgi:hypothetical protein